MTLLFLDFSGGEFLLIAVVFLMFFGSKSIPGIARSLGKVMREFRDAAGSVQREIQESANLNMKDFDMNQQNTKNNTQGAPTLPPVTSAPHSQPMKEAKSTETEAKNNTENSGAKG